MGTKLPPTEASAYEAMDRLLYREWDPIGVSDAPEAEDEYRSYLPEFWRLVRSDATNGEIASLLERAETHISLQTSLAHREDIATKAKAILLAWRLPVRP